MKGDPIMTEDEARRLIADLTEEEKVLLAAMLSGLVQTRQLTY